MRIEGPERVPPFARSEFRGGHVNERAPLGVSEKKCDEARETYSGGQNGDGQQPRGRGPAPHHRP